MIGAWVVAGVLAQAVGPREVFPHVRVDAEARVVEIDAVVPIDTRDADAPDVYLEVVLCARDSREHEALAMTDARPSHVHAALLLVGLEPGSPGAIVRTATGVERRAPTGPAVRVEMVTRDEHGAEVVRPVGSWIRMDGEGGFPADASWVFAGSRMREVGGAEAYDADGTGQIVGLHTFGSEVVGLAAVWSPDSGVDAPEWLADGAVVPPRGTPVVVRLTAE